MSTLEQARVAKAKILERLHGRHQVGIGKIGEEYVLRVGFECHLAGGPTIPGEVDGVKVQVYRNGTIDARSVLYKIEHVE